MRAVVLMFINKKLSDFLEFLKLFITYSWVSKNKQKQNQREGFILSFYNWGKNANCNNHFTLKPFQLSYSTPFASAPLAV